MQDRADITSQHWSLKVGRRDPNTGEVVPHFGEIVSGVCDLHQAISNLILTPLGAVPTEPEKGCDLMPWIDRHADEAIPNITRAIWDALTIWEPRIVLQDVVVNEDQFHTLSVAVHWRPSASVLDELTVTEVSLGGTLERRVA